MSKSKKDGPSCFGLFVKTWLLSMLVFGGMVAAVVGLGIRYLGWNSQSWSEFTAWTSYPVLALIGVGATATVVAFMVAALIGMASAFLGGGKSKASGGSSSRPAKVRPQSSRKTTV